MPGARVAAGDRLGYLPVFEAGDPINPHWAGQEATRVPGQLERRPELLPQRVRARAQPLRGRVPPAARAAPDADSGLRHPAKPARVLRYRDLSDDELFEVARLVIAAEIAKAHTVEWTPQLLYDEPLRLALRANWSACSTPTPTRPGSRSRRSSGTLGRSGDADPAHGTWYSVFASGPGIFGLGSRVIRGGAPAGKVDVWSLANPEHVNGGTNHFGSPFNFPEEFVTVYRLHPMLPDLLELRTLDPDPNVVRLKIPVRGHDPRPGDAGDARRSASRAGPCPLGRQRARPPDAPEPPAVPAGPRRAGRSAGPTGSSTSPPSTSSETASGACRGSTSSAASTGSGS